MIYFVMLLAQFLAVMIVITVHEWSHAYAAYKCGDPTAKFSGRMTLNPVKHFDPLGILMFAVAGFGWAKPVPINPNNFHNYKTGSVWTSAAGVLANYVMAFVFYPVFILTVYYVLPVFSGKILADFLYVFTSALFTCSLSFCVFNLLPFYPLDGFRLYDALNKRRSKVYWFLRQYGYYILMGLILVHVLSSRVPVLGFVDLLGYILDFAIKIFGRPIMLFWDWMFRLIL